MSDPEFFVKPKSLNKHYRKTTYTITFLPATKQWQWEVIYIQTTKYHDTAPTMIAAQKAAERHIDKTLRLRGVK